MEDEYQNFKIETAYNHIRVCQSKGVLEFRSGDDALQSVINLQKPQHLELMNLEYLIAVLLFIDDPRKILMLGTAAGSLLHFFRHYYPACHITAVDIDVEFIELLITKEILPAAQTGLSYVYDDAANFIAHSNQTYDLILIDLFKGSQSPAWLQQKKSIVNLQRMLNRQGALAYNLLIGSEYDFKCFYRDLRQVFDENTLCLPVKGFENTIAYGFNHPQAANNMSSNMQNALKMSDRLGIDLMRVLSVIYNTNPVGRGMI